MTKTLLSLFFAVALSLNSIAQEEKQFVRFQEPISTSTQKYNFLKPIFSDVTIVGLGEASHGTEEFIKVKSDIVKSLIMDQGFTTLAFEMDEVVAKQLDTYVNGGKNGVDSVLKGYGLYNSYTLLQLVDWIKSHNIKAKKKVEILGFDSSDYWSNPFTRDSLMAENFARKKVDGTKYIIWAHNTHLLKSNTWDVTKTGIKAMGQHLYSKYKDDFFLVALHTQLGTYRVVEDGELPSYPFDFTNTPDFFDPSNGVLNSYFLNLKHRAILDQVFNIGNLFSNRRETFEGLPVLPGKDFDAVIYFRETSSSIPIP